MNAVHIRKVADAIGNTPGVGFNMGVHVCKTTPDVTDKTGQTQPYVASIDGTAFLLATGKTPQEASRAHWRQVETVAKDYLQISTEQAWRLFFDLPEDIDLEDVTPEMAREVLERLAETGEVDWIGNGNA